MAGAGLSPAPTRERKKMLRIKDIKKGETFYEGDIKFIALEDGKEAGDLDGAKQWSVRGRSAYTGEFVPFLETEGAEHYGPRLQREPRRRSAHVVIRTEPNPTEQSPHEP
jgi:hypothetical protein